MVNEDTNAYMSPAATHKLATQPESGKALL